MAYKRWLQRTIQMRWTRGEKWDMPNYTRTWLKSCGSNTSKFEVFGSTCCKYVRRRSGESYHIVFSLQQNVLEALSWFGEAFHPVSVGDRNWWNYEHRIFWFTMWKASDMQLIHLTFLNDLKHTANVKKNNTIKHYQSWMASPEPEPDHYWSQHPKKSFVCSSRGSKKYSWKLLNALTRKLSKRVQALLKNKSGHA